MPAQDPQGEMQFWEKGMPSLGLNDSVNDGGQLQFWFKGSPYQYLFPATAGGTSLILSMDGVFQASIGSVNGIANASIKSIDGVNNV